MLTKSSLSSANAQSAILNTHAPKRANHATQTLLLFFAGIITLGSLLLMLPIASKSGVSCGPLTAAFTATSATCVTGLSVVDTYTQWTLFGQVVVLALIQAGGLGYMTVVSLFYFTIRRKIDLRERLILQQSLALNELDGVIRLVKLVLLGTFLIEGTGAIILTIRFSTILPMQDAIWFGIFHSISAFCNAGFDLIGIFQPSSSLMMFVGDPVVNITIMLLIAIGGLGFFVWNDLLMHKFQWKRLSVYTKLVLIITAILIFGGAASILLLEWNNPGTFGPLSPLEKILAAFFQSVTCRTAGFCTVDQNALTDSSKLISMLLMLVGGSSGSTAGGIKTVTVGILALMAIRVLKNRTETVVFDRKIGQHQINIAASLTLIVVSFCLFGGIVLSATNGISLINSLYEVVSAFCTVGLTAGITATLNVESAILLILYMFFGRVGIMTISFAFILKVPKENAIKRPDTQILVG